MSVLAPARAPIPRRERGLSAYHPTRAARPHRLPLDRHRCADRRRVVEPWTDPRRRSASPVRVTGPRHRSASPVRVADLRSRDRSSAHQERTWRDELRRLVNCFLGVHQPRNRSLPPSIHAHETTRCHEWAGLRSSRAHMTTPGPPQLRGHNSCPPAPGSRLPCHNSWATTPAPRLLGPGSRATTPGPQLLPPGSRAPAPGTPAPGPRLLGRAQQLTHPGKG
jgi:hypothetical protein